MRGPTPTKNAMPDIEFPIDGRAFLRPASDAIIAAAKRHSGKLSNLKGCGLGCLALVIALLCAGLVYVIRQNNGPDKLPLLYMLCDFRASEGRLFKRSETIYPKADSTEVSIVINQNLDVPRRFTTDKPLTTYYKPDEVVTCIDTVRKSEALAKTGIRENGNDYLSGGESAISIGMKDGAKAAEIRLQAGSLDYRERGRPRPPENVVPAISSQAPVPVPPKKRTTENYQPTTRIITKVEERKIYIRPTARLTMQKALQSIISGAKLDEDQKMLVSRRAFGIYVKGNGDSITCTPVMITGDSNEEAELACDIVQRQFAFVANQVDKKDYLRGQTVRVRF
jgi:hypothetical protein